MKLPQSLGPGLPNISQQWAHKTTWATNSAYPIFQMWVDGAEKKMQANLKDVAATPASQDGSHHVLGSKSPFQFPALGKAQRRTERNRHLDSKLGLEGNGDMTHDEWGGNEQWESTI